MTESTDGSKIARWQDYALYRDWMGGLSRLPDLVRRPRRVTRNAFRAYDMITAARGSTDTNECPLHFSRRDRRGKDRVFGLDTLMRLVPCSGRRPRLPFRRSASSFFTGPSVPKSTSRAC